MTQISIFSVRYDLKCVLCAGLQVRYPDSSLVSRENAQRLYSLNLFPASMVPELVTLNINDQFYRQFK